MKNNEPFDTEPPTLQQLILGTLLLLCFAAAAILVFMEGMK